MSGLFWSGFPKREEIPEMVAEVGLREEDDESPFGAAEFRALVFWSGHDQGRRRSRVPGLLSAGRRLERETHTGHVSQSAFPRAWICGWVEGTPEDHQRR